MVNVSEIVKTLDSLIAEKLAIPQIQAQGLAEMVRDGESVYPANNGMRCGYNDTFAISWYHRAKGGKVETDTRGGQGRQLFQAERWEMLLIAYADRRKLEDMRPDELYRRFAQIFPIFDSTAPFEGTEISGGSATIQRFSLDKYAIVGAEYGGTQKNYGPEMIAIQLEYQLFIELRPACVVLRCVPAKKC